MGFFGDLWDGIKSTASNVWGGVKNLATNVYSGVKSVGDWVGNNIQPIVRGIADYAGYVPVIGSAISGVANSIDKGITGARKVIDNVGRWGSSIGEVVDRIVPNQTQAQKQATLGELRRRFQRPM
jgi:phage-related protein